tara:strand:+ start:1980 stop:3152 length:1173 start_codon:yes stop_codon:yes gene_type:complete
MIKGSNRRMFRRPGSARKAAGILASSRELMNQVEPIRMAPGGLQNDAVAERDFLAKYEQLLLEQAQKKPFSGNFLTDLGLGAVTASLQNPNLGTLESIAAGLTQALPMQTKRRQAEDARELALLEGQMKIETARTEREKRAREDEKARAAIFGAQYTDATLNALGRAGYRPDIENNGFSKGGKTFSLDEIISPESPTFDKDAYEKYQQSMQPKLTEGQAMLETLLGESSTYEEALTASGLLASRLDKELQATELKNYKSSAAERFAKRVQEEKQKDEKYKNSSFDIIEIDPTLIETARTSVASGLANPVQGLDGMVNTTDFALVEVETVQDNGDIVTEYFTPKGELVTVVKTDVNELKKSKPDITKEQIEKEHNEKTNALFRIPGLNAYR